MDKDLKSCPFCGSERVGFSSEHYYGMRTPVIFVECSECKGRGGRSTNGDRNVAKKRWNTRKKLIKTDI